MRREEELDVTVRTLETLRQHEPTLETIVVDDRSPAQELLVDLQEACDRFEMTLRVKDANGGFAKTVNIGLREAQDRGLDAVLVNADMEFTMPFVETFEQTVDSQSRPAAVVGALLIYPSGLIQHGGIFLGLYNRGFDHKFKYGPASLPEAHRPAICPVTGALFFIRHSTFEAIGLFDEDFGLAFEDVDYCLRVFEGGLECVYNPDVRALHHESMFRGDADDTIDEYHQRSIDLLYEKHGQTPLGRYVLPLA